MGDANTVSAAPRASAGEPALSVLALTVALAALGLALHTLRWPSLSQPLEYNGDSLWVFGLLQTMAEHGWYWHTPRVGAPGAMDLVLFPISENGHLLVMRALLGLGLGPITVANTYFVLTFPLTAAVTCAALLRARVAPGFAWLGALAYALMPYHFFRGTQHLMLSGYFVVPLWSLLVLGVAGLLDERARLPRRVELALACALPFFGIYYTVFFAYLALVAASLESVSRRRPGPLRDAAGLVLAAFASTFVNLLPTFVFQARTGERATLERLAADTEWFGLKLTQMLLPPPGHRAGWLASLEREYNRTAPINTENQYASLGIFLGALFVAFTLAAFAAAWRGREGEERTRRVGVLLAAAFGFATVGGLSSLVGYLVSPFIRSTNRIVVFMAFLLVPGVAWAFGETWARLCARWPGVGRRPWVLVGLAALLVGWDATDVDFFPERPAQLARQRSDRQFFSALEASLPRGARVFQMPYVAYPEAGFYRRDYFPLRPYLNTAQVVWSFGAMRGTAGDRANQRLAGMVNNRSGFVAALRAEGFVGVLLHRPVDPRGRAESALRSTLGDSSRTSADGEFAYFTLP